MVIQKQILSKLREFGLNTYETKLWTALLSRGVSTAGELSDIANVPRSRSYDVLESLEKKGFIIMKLGKPIKYIAVPPKEVIDRVKKKVVEDAKAQSEILDELHTSEVLGELGLLYDQGVRRIEPTELSGSVRGRTSLYNHMSTMINNSQKSVILATTPSDFLRKAEALKSAFVRANNRGVKIRVLSTIPTQESREAAATLEKAADVRHTSTSLPRFCVVDGKDLFFMLLEDTKVHPSYDTGVWVNTPFFSNTVVSYFENEWQKATPLDKLKQK